MRHRLRTLPLLIASVLLATGCAGLRPAAVPMATELVRSACARPAETLLVMLPGASSTPDEFVREGFVDALRERSIAADVLLADAHMGYYRGRSVLERLRADVLAPARTAGYRSIWLVGISLGGFGALLHEEAHPGEVDGLIVLAPYLGEREITQGIAAAGSLGAWQAPAATPGAQEAEIRLWRWLQSTYSGPNPPAAAATRLYLGFGLDDRFAASHQLLARAMPSDRVTTTPGGHDWPPWRRLWQQLLAVVPLPVCAGPAPRS